LQALRHSNLATQTTPKLYPTTVSAGGDFLTGEIGFRSIEIKGCDLLLNDKPVLLKGVNLHEEIPQRLGRASSDADAAMILNEVKAVGCNFIRTAHPPPSAQPGWLEPQGPRFRQRAAQEGVVGGEQILRNPPSRRPRPGR
jgi:hypothetical protein